MTAEITHGRVLALYATPRGFAYGLFEGPLSPIDWGVKDVKGPRKNLKCLSTIVQIIDVTNPDVIVIEDCSVTGSRRSARIRRLYLAILQLGGTRSLEVSAISRATVRACFSRFGAATKHEIAQAIAKNLPAFEHRLPPLRKPWMSEDPRMSLFDAVALILAFYHLAPPDT